MRHKLICSCVHVAKRRQINLSITCGSSFAVIFSFVLSIYLPCHLACQLLSRKHGAREEMVISKINNRSRDTIAVRVVTINSVVFGSHGQIALVFSSLPLVFVRFVCLFSFIVVVIVGVLH